MRGWLLDTNVIAEVARPGGDPEVRNWLAARDEGAVYISVITLADYDKGIANLATESPARSRLTALIADLEARFAGRILSVSDPIVRRWGHVSGEAQRRSGRSPPVIDALLVATALEHDLCLATRNVRDVRGLGATILNPWQRPDP